MRLSRRVVICSCVVLLATMGCASVDPSADYEQAVTRISEATGRTSMYRPDHDAAIEARVDSLLCGGLTADEAVEVAILNNPRLQATWMNIGMARADFVQAGLLSNPSLGGSLRFPSGGGLANFEAAIAQNIADLWRIPARKRAAGADLEQTILNLARQAADLTADARIAYYRAVGATELHQVAHENLTIARQLLELAVGRQEAGAGTELDVNLSQGEVLEAELAVEAARLDLDESRRTLARLLGLAFDPQTLGLVDELPTAFDGHFEAERVIEHARQKRLDIRAAERAVAAAEAGLREERVRVWPLAELGVSAERGERKSLSSSDEGTDFVIGPTWELELPLFDQNQAQIAKAEFAHEQARRELESVGREATQDVRGACDRLATAWSIARLYADRSIPLARRSLELSREAYNAGRASFPAVLEAQRFYLDTRRRSIEALAEAAVRIPELERAAASPLSELREILRELPGSRSSSRPAQTTMEAKP